MSGSASSSLTPRPPPTSSSGTYSRCTVRVGAKPAARSRSSASTYWLPTLFMSCVPRPYTLPPRSSAAHGSTLHFAASAGTTSMCELSTSDGSSGRAPGHVMTTSGWPGASSTARKPQPPAAASDRSSSTASR